MEGIDESVVECYRRWLSKKSYSPRLSRCRVGDVEDHFTGR